ncbi:MAG: hypothetical protein DMG73_15615 [Acidobacteria bacterium]|nr:MAG: hypothetical protein DMG73_15615 [Acidobacteriota bacterium]PYX64964.1 MAG: hypothetical protein DMG74_10605 [Acidobacteriota bacterium]
MLKHLRQQARRELLAESRKHRITANCDRFPMVALVHATVVPGLVNDLERSEAGLVRRCGTVI